MSQNILANGYAILLANDSDLDRYLLAKDYLLRRIKSIGERKQIEQSNAIVERQKQINSINSILHSDQNLSYDTRLSYQNIVEQLEAQIERLEVRNTKATFDDIRESHAVFFNQTYKPIISVAYGYSKVNTTPLPLLGSSSRLKIPINGDFFTDMVLYLKLSDFNAVHKNNRVRYCEFPGHRIIKEVRFVIDSVVIDKYGSEDINFYYDFQISDSQKAGWKRCVGQETPKRAIFIQDPSHQEVREQKMIYDGFQTLKQSHEPMEIFLPLQFWFCDPKFAMSNFNISYDKTFIEIDLVGQEDLVACIDYANDGGKYKPPVVVDCALFTNHIYTIPEVADLFVYKNAFNIIRIHKSMERILNKQFDMIDLESLRFAVENIMIHFRPIVNETNENKSETWNNNNIITYKEIDHPSIVKIAGVKTLAYTPIYYYTEEPVVDALGLIANGGTIYGDNSGTFYDSYLPFRFGKDSVMTPSKRGSYLMTFSLYPQEEQPSGYLNLSNAKENYLTYNSNYINMDHPVRLYMSARVINFLYLNKGTVSIRFAT